MAVPNVTLECHPHVCCSQQGETVWMMEKYASTYRQEMGWCLRILSSKIIHCSKGIGSKNEQTDRHYNLLFRCISQIASLFRKKRISFFIFLQLQGYKISCWKIYAIDLRTMNFRMIMLMTLSSFMVKTAVIINFICKEVEFSQLSKPSLCYHLFVWHFSMIIDFNKNFSGGFHIPYLV